MSSVELRQIVKSFPGRKGKSTQVLRGIDVQVEEGEFLAILGSSGCGKSTLLRLISGLDLATGGTISINGKDVSAAAPEKRELAMVFQNYALFPHLTVQENILFGLKSRREPKELLTERLDETARLLGLEDLLDRKPAELSGGQRQRVALGRALVSGKRLILMDEPLSNLDAKLRAEMRVEIKRIQRHLGLTIIYVTHDQVEAMTMADRVLMMSQGIVEQLASPEVLYNTPESVTVARFIGSPPMNIIDIVAADELSHLLPDHYRMRGASLGVRPESLDIHYQSELISGDRVRLGEARVMVNELLGADRVISTAFYSRDGQQGQSVTARVSPDRDINADEKVILTASPEDMHWYCLESGRRLESFQAPAALGV